jgi:hypothetical protein
MLEGKVLLGGWTSGARLGPLCALPPLLQDINHQHLNRKERKAVDKQHPIRLDNLLGQGKDLHVHRVPLLCVRSKLLARMAPQTPTATPEDGRWQDYAVVGCLQGIHNRNI